MRIAVASQNFRTITGHAGKTRRFLVFHALPGQPAIEIARLDLPKEMAMHDFHSAGPHPLDQMDAMIVGSAGPGFIARMAGRGVRAVITALTDPAVAAAALADGRLPLLAPEGAEGEGHAHHGHDHTHGDDDGCGCGGSGKG